MARVLIISAWGGSIILLRGDLIKEMVKNGHEVFAAAPEEEYRHNIEGLGARFVPILLARTSLNPMSDFFSIYNLYVLIKNIKPEIVFSYNIKPILYGSIAASFAGVPGIYSMIAGLGYAYGASKTLKQRLISTLINLPYKYAVSVCGNIFFQNPDDIKLLKEMGILKKSEKAVLINGSGVNLAKFEQKPIPVGPTSFILVARMIWDKGIGEYVEAARILKAKYPQTRFKLLGPLDINPNAIHLGQLELWEDEGIIEYLGETDDVRPYLAETSVFVLPSFYREGTPRSILEALAVGRPVITTDSPGCRETVRSGVNGLLIPVKDVEALIQAMERYILDPHLVSEMGEASRIIAEEKYDVREVNNLIISCMGLG